VKTREGDKWSHDENRLLAGVQYILLWQDIRVRYNFDYRWRSHRHRQTLLPQNQPGTKKRKDWYGIHVVSVPKILP
jgi:hypothetical protein